MLTYVILTGIVVFGVGFVLWLGTFLLNNSLNTALETAAESRRRVAGQLGYGALLLGITVVLGVVFFQMDREPVIPSMPPGLQPEGIRRLGNTPAEEERKAKDTVSPPAVATPESSATPAPVKSPAAGVELGNPLEGSLVS